MSYILIDPTCKVCPVPYAIDYFGGEAALKEYYHRPWKEQKFWRTRRLECIVIQIGVDDDRQPELSSLKPFTFYK